MRNYEKNRNEEFQLNGMFIFITFVFVVCLMVLFSSMYTIHAGERGVLLTWGQPNQIAMGEGLHFKMPIAQKIVKIDVKTTKIEEVGDSASKDLQDVQTTIALNYHLSPEQVPKLYQEIGLSYSDRIIRPAIQEAIKSATATFTAEELITRRTEVKNKIKIQLKEVLGGYYIIVDDFNIVNFQFSESFDSAIEAKVTAEQDALRAERELEKVKFEAEQKITTAKAEAESIRIQSEALLQSKEILELRWIEKWDGEMPTTYITGGQDLLIGINPEQSTQ